MRITYRYKDNTKMKDLHISVIKRGEKIPQIGNLFNFIRANSRTTYFDNKENIYFGEWKTNKIITFYTTNRESAKRQLNNQTDFLIEFVEKKCPDTGNNPAECPVKSMNAEAVPSSKIFRSRKS